MKLVCSDCGAEFPFRFIGCVCDCGGELCEKTECRVCGNDIISPQIINATICEDCKESLLLGRLFRERMATIDNSNIEKCIELRDKVVGTFGWEYADALCGLINFIEELQAIANNK